ncbi:MAG TPA: DUF4476 domain-containing protein [Myxococcaceae bacterium]|nr:DUF4476 domain-containing protein [Myxococcaceae bacterium]
MHWVHDMIRYLGIAIVLQIATAWAVLAQGHHPAKAAQKAARPEALRPVEGDASAEAISGFELDALKVTVKESPQAQRKAVMERLAGHARFTTAQASELLTAFSQTERFKLLPWIGQRILDREKILTLCEKFGSPAERQRAREILQPMVAVNSARAEAGGAGPE